MAGKYIFDPSILEHVEISPAGGLRNVEVIIRFLWSVNKKRNVLKHYNLLVCMESRGCKRGF